LAWLETVAGMKSEDGPMPADSHAIVLLSDAVRKRFASQLTDSSQKSQRGVLH
jgi:hypothetical protein